MASSVGHVVVKGEIQGVAVVIPWILSVLLNGGSGIASNHFPRPTITASVQ